MNILEIPSGSGVMAKAFKKRGHNTFTIDIDKNLNPDLVQDILTLSLSQIPFKPDVIWASVPCECFSVASIGHNWTQDYRPKRAKTLLGMAVAMRTLEIIRELNPKYFFIENPRGVLRKMHFMKNLQRTYITQCSYGLKSMKPTDIWHNTSMVFKKPCENGDNCHESAPRGSRTGTQGLKGAYERGILAEGLCEAIVDYCEGKSILEQRRLSDL